MNTADRSLCLYCGIGCTLVYLALFFPSFYIGMLCPHLFENASVTTATGLAIIFLSMLAPLSLMVGVAMIWYYYFAGEYKKAFYACGFPVAACVVILFCMMIIRVIFL